MRFDRQRQRYRRGRRKFSAAIQGEIASRDGAHIRVFPLFVTPGRKTQCLETRHPRLTPRGDPARLTLLRLIVLAAALGETFEERGHFALYITHAADSSTTQS